jgi:histidyl-tRNA synthetase
VIDKLDKIGRDGVIDALKDLGRETAEKLFSDLATAKPTERVWQIFEVLKQFGLRESVDFTFDPFLARGLDYYTSTIFELKTPSYTAGSLAGGGRYDELIGQLGGKSAPAVGIAFGFDRMIEALTQSQLLSNTKTSTLVLVTIFSPDLMGKALSITAKLRASGINTEVVLNPNQKLDRQLKYADTKGIPYVIIQGPDEASKNVVKLKNMRRNEQVELSVDQVVSKLTDS